MNGKKTQTEKGLTEIYHKLQKEGLTSGIARSYRPRDAEGEKLPSENKHVQLKVKNLLDDASKILTDLFDCVASQEYGNCEAKANVVVDGKTVLSSVPVSYLMFLEKQLIHVNTLVSKMPTLDPAAEWEFSEVQDCYATRPVESVKTKKVPKNHVLAEATDKHPAQVQVYNEDVLTGYWTTINYSGAVPESQKNATLERIKRLQEAVKMAREEANLQEVQKQNIGEPVFNYLFGK